MSVDRPLEGRRVLILIEDGSFPLDSRVRRQAASLTSAGMRVSVVCPRYRGQRFTETVGEVAVYRYPVIQLESFAGHLLEYGISLFMMFTLACFIRYRRGFDVIHACNPPDLLFLVALPFRLLGTKFLFDHHDLCPELYVARFGRPGSLMYRLMLAAERLSIRTADVVVSTNESYRQRMIERAGSNPDKTIVVRNGPDLGTFSPAEGGREELCPAGVTTLVGYVGNMNTQDGVDYLLRAIAELSRRGRRDIGAVLVGSGDARPALDALCQELHLEDRVRFTGRIDDAALRRALTACDLCVQPDPSNPLNDVSTMNKVMEYMALGKPLVAFDLIETRVSAGEAALYAEPNRVESYANQIERLADDPDLRQRMGRIGRQRVEDELAWHHQEASLWQAYAALWNLTMPAAASKGTSEPASVNAQDAPSLSRGRKSVQVSGSR
ncbi:MAG: glycosyltransferase family 4 protein [Planctomycetota bacterium]